MEIKIRNATINDASAIAAINIASWQTTYHGLIADATLENMKPDDYLAKWNNIIANAESRGSFVIIAENEKHEIIGYASGGKNRNEKFSFEAELYAIYLLKEYQGHGIGKALFQRSLEKFRSLNISSMLLFVLSSNTSSRKFYESFNPDFTSEERITIDNEQYNDYCYGWTELPNR